MKKSNDIDIAPKRGRPRGKPGTNMNVKDRFDGSDADIARIIRESSQYYGRKPPKDNAEFEQRLKDYFRDCIEKPQIPTIEDMALALGVNRSMITKWANGLRGDQERCRMIQQAREVLAAIDAKLVEEGKIPQVTYIFRAKNYFGMKDQQDMVITPDLDRTDDRMEEEKFWKKYLGPALDNASDGESLPKLEDKQE